MDIAGFSSPVEAQMTLEALLTKMDSFLFDFPSGTPHPAAFTEFPFADPLSPHSDNLPAVSTSPSTARPAGRTIAVQDLVADSRVDGKDKAATASSPRRLRERQMPVEAMREMVFRIAAMQPIHIDPDSIKPPKRRNVRISKEPQSVAARHRRERISERIRILQQLVPGGTKMDTASMLEEAVHYVKFLKSQVQSLETAAGGGSSTPAGWPSAPSPAGGCDP